MKTDTMATRLLIEDNAKETEILAIDEKAKMQLTIWYAHVSDGDFM